MEPSFLHNYTDSTPTLSRLNLVSRDKVCYHSICEGEGAHGHFPMFIKRDPRR
ncbi:hypothetical protein ACM6L3_18510 [Paenibacillus larvae]